MEQPKSDKEIQTSTPSSESTPPSDTSYKANQIQCPECKDPLTRNGIELDIFYCINATCHLFKDRFTTYKIILRTK